MRAHEGTDAPGRPHRWLLGAALLVAACSGGPEPDDAAPPDGGSRDAAIDAGGDASVPADSGPTDSGPTDSGPTDSGPTDSGPTDSGPTDAGPTDLCTDGTFLEDCPDRPCEVVTGCSEARCVYAPFVCTASGVCPVLGCESMTSPRGDLVNRCVEQVGAACGGGMGTCSGSSCVPTRTGLRLRSGGLRVGTSGGTIDTAGGRFRLMGQVGFVPSDLAPHQAGRVRLTGGLRP